MTSCWLAAAVVVHQCVTLPFAVALVVVYTEPDRLQFAFVAACLVLMSNVDRCYTT
jgi:hypothetical protein